MKFFSEAFLQAIVTAGLHQQYYQICKGHPANHAGKVKVAVRDVLEAAKDRVSIKKLKGPSLTYVFDDIAEGYELRAVLYLTGAVQVSFSAYYRGKQQAGPLTMLAHHATLVTSGSEPNPPYQRPDYRSVDELIAIFEEIQKLMSDIIDLCEKESPA